ncbi:MAG TPA: DUF2336 domain-containing protein [Rhodospirillaceae bacterium]|nr:DUF2336 domain-containing protein [Rhodospirillaceae bacterium]
MKGIIATLRAVFRGKAEIRPAEPLPAPDSDSLTYEQARELARHEDPEVRRQLARRRDVRPEILFFLAEDPEAEVRREIAANLSTPAHADLRLAADADASVRSDLAQKIARLAPGLSADERDRLRQMTYDALLLLARDQITRVRQILAEALKDVAQAPPELVRRLAHDSELSVASPILQFSPVLTDEDLLEIIQSPPVAGALSAISRRTQVAGEVADAIANSDDIDAIAVLLANPSAQIREETLDLLLDRAPEREPWHGPMVRRPHLSARAATRLARFVADNLLQVLDGRDDFDLATKQAVAAVVRRRVEDSGSEMADFRRGEAKPPAVPEGETPWQQAERLHRSGGLNDRAFGEALIAGNLVLVVNGLAVAAGVPLEVVQKIVSTQSAKGMTALAWQAGLNPKTSVALQTQLARIAPADVLKPRPGTQVFPIGPSEMTWQLDFFASMAGGSKHAAADQASRDPA